LAKKFGENSTNLSLKFRVLFIGEIDQQIFRAPAATFHLSKSLVKSTPADPTTFL